MMRRGLGRGRRGIVGTMATTAVVVGTASAVAGASANRQQAGAQQAADAQAYQQMQQEQAMQAAAQAAVAQQVAAQPVAAAPAAPAAGGDLISKLKDLAALKEQGILSEEEFAAAKAQLLAG